MSSNIAVSISADTTQLTAQLAVAKADLSATTAELRRTAQAMREAGTGAGDDLKSGLTQAAEAAAKAQASVSALRAKLADTVAPINGVAAAGEHQAGIFREKMVMAHEALMGNYSRLIGSSMVLAERTGGIGAAFATMVNPTTLAIGAVVAVVGGFAKLVVSAEEAERSLNKLKDAFTAVGHGGMMSNTGIEEMVGRIAHLPGVSREAAEQIVSDFARTRQIGGDLFRALAEDIDRSARVMGVDAPEAAKQLASAFADPAKGAHELDAAYNILTAAQLQQIDTLQRQGDRIGAQTVLLQAWKARLGELPPGLTEIQTASNNLGNAWDTLTHSIGETESWKSARAAVAGLFNTLTQGMNLMSGAANAAPKIPLDGQIRDTEKTVQMLTRRLEEMHRTASRPIDIQYVEDLLNRTEARLAALKAESGQVSAAQTQQRDDAVKDQTTEQRKADLNDPALLTQQQKMRDIEDVITRLKNEQVGATDKEKTQLQDIIAMKEKEKSDLLKGDTDSAPSKMEQWRTELSQRQEALAQQHASEQTYAAQALKLEVDFWSQKMALVKAGSKEQLEAEKARSDAVKRLYQEEAKAAEQAARDKQAISKQDSDTDLAIAKINLAEKKQILDEEAAAAKITDREKVASLKQFTEEAYQLDLKRLQDELASLNDQPKEYDRVYNEIRKLTAQHNADMAALSRQAVQAQTKDSHQTSQAWQEAFAPISRAFDGMVSGIFQGTQSIGQAAQRMAGNMALSFAEAITKMLLQFGLFKLANALGWTQIATAAASEQTALSAAVLGKEATMTSATQAGAAARNAAGATEQAGFFTRIGSQLAEWLGLETGKTTATVSGSAARDTADGTSAAAAVVAAKAEAAGTIPAYAAEAGAAAMQSVAAIPIVGWAMAPAVGAETFAAAMAFLPMASAAGGWDRVPYDGALAELHKDEMVLPAAIANPLRAMTLAMPAYARTALQSPSAPSSASSSTSSSSGGGAQNVQITINANDASSFATMLKNPASARALVQAINAQAALGTKLSSART